MDDMDGDGRGNGCVGFSALRHFLPNIGERSFGVRRKKKAFKSGLERCESGRNDRYPICAESFFFIKRFGDYVFNVSCGDLMRHRRQIWN